MKELLVIIGFITLIFIAGVYNVEESSDTYYEFDNLCSSFSLDALWDMSGDEECYDEFLEKGRSLVQERIYESLWNCTVDCSGHIAGYNWADNNNLKLPEDCGGNSYSFIEGCMAYTLEYLLEGIYFDSPQQLEDEYYKILNL